MKFRKLDSIDIDKLMEALDKAGEDELRDYFRKLYDATLVEGNKRITFTATPELVDWYYKTDFPVD